MFSFFRVNLRNSSKCLKQNLYEPSRTKSSLPCVGHRACLVKAFTQDDVDRYAELTGDRNVIHSVAASTKTPGSFPKPIVHGLLIGGLVSAVVGTKLPGSGSILVSQAVRFHSPLFVGNEVKAEVVVTDIKKKFVFLSFECKDTSSNNGKTVLSGNIVVLLPERMDITSSS